MKESRIRPDRYALVALLVSTAGLAALQSAAAKQQVTVELMARVVGG